MIIGSFAGREEEDLYVWIHRFESERERERLYQAVYQSDRWKTNIGPKIPAMMGRERIKLTGMEATRKSVIRQGTSPPTLGPILSRAA